MNKCRATFALAIIGCAVIAMMMLFNQQIETELGIFFVRVAEGIGNMAVAELAAVTSMF